jgi:uncharacterized protein
MQHIPLYPVRATDPPITLDVEQLVKTRMLIQGSSGGGKSWCLRYILENSFGTVPHFILDVEGEFASLRERFPYLLIGADGDLPLTLTTAARLAPRLMAARASAILNLSDLDKTARRLIVAGFVGALLDAPLADRHPYLVVIDEAHEFAPERGSAESLPAIAALTSKGRKRGLGAILATQRISKLHKDAAADLHNVLIGLTSLDVDSARAGDTLGFDKAARAQLRSLEHGQFYAYGPAISRSVVLVRTGPVQTSHDQEQPIQPAAPVELHALIRVLAAEMPAAPGQDTDPVPPAPAARQRTADGVVYRQADLDAAVQRTRAACHADLVAWQVYAAVLRQQLDDLHLALQPLGSLLTTALPFPPAPVGATDSPGTGDLSAPPDPRVGRRPARRPAAPPADQDAARLTAPQQRIVDALLRLEQAGNPQPQRNNVAVFADQSPRSSGFTNNLSRLRSLGLIDYPTAGTLGLTDRGRAAAAGATTPMTVEHIHQAWMQYLPKPQARIVAVLIRVYPQALDRGHVADQAQQSPTSSGFTNNLSALRSLGLLDYPSPKTVVATALLFPEVH